MPPFPLFASDWLRTKQVPLPPYHCEEEVAQLHKERRQALLSSLPEPEGWEIQFAFRLSQIDMESLFFGLKCTAALSRLPFFTFQQKFMLYVREYVDRGFDPEYHGFQDIIATLS